MTSEKHGKTFTAIREQYDLRGATAMQECMTKDISYNQPFELAYWRYGLSVAQQWRERQGLERNTLWDEIIRRIAPLPEKDGIYIAGLPRGKTDALEAFDPFDTVGGITGIPENEEDTDKASQNKKTSRLESFTDKLRHDHPAVMGAVGMLPLQKVLAGKPIMEEQTLWERWTRQQPRVRTLPPLYDDAKMRSTLDWVMKNWDWQTTWGWDYGMIAMAAARLGNTKTAVDALLLNTQKNTYLINGHNFQTADRLRLYLPGNGALLTAVAMMCAGWDGCTESNNPGFPKDGTWNVRWEGLQRMQ